MANRTWTEEFKVSSKEVLDKVEEILKEGNARRIIIRNDTGHTLLDISLTVAIVGTVIAPVLAAAGGVAALVSRCTIVVERSE